MLISVAADIRWSHYFLVAGVLTVAVLAPYLIDRFWFRRHVIRFPLRSGRRWTVAEKVYMFSVVGLAWLIMPFYFIRSGTYLNWPAPREPSELARLFVGVNAVGLWDELFFICTVFTLLRRHLPLWQANLLQAVIFVSFLWELGYTSWGPFLTYPFALIQGYLFARTALAAVRADHPPGLRLRALADPGARPQPGLDTEDLPLLAARPRATGGRHWLCGFPRKPGNPALCP